MERTRQNFQLPAVKYADSQFCVSFCMAMGLGVSRWKIHIADSVRGQVAEEDTGA